MAMSEFKSHNARSVGRSVGELPESLADVQGRVNWQRPDWRVTISKTYKRNDGQERTANGALWRQQDPRRSDRVATLATVLTANTLVPTLGL